MKNVITFLVIVISFFLFSSHTKSVDQCNTGRAGGEKGSLFYEHALPQGSTISSIKMYHGRIVDGIEIYYQKQCNKSPYSMDANLHHISYKGDI